MKNILKLTSVITLLMVLSSCSVESLDEVIVNNNTSVENVTEQQMTCSGEQPKTRVINNGTTTFILEVVNSDGAIIVSQPGINPGHITNWSSFAEGEVLFALSNPTGDTTDDKVLLTMDSCMAYEIVIDANNNIVSYVPTNL